MNKSTSGNDIRDNASETGGYVDIMDMLISKPRGHHMTLFQYRD